MFARTFRSGLLLLVLATMPLLMLMGCAGHRAEPALTVRPQISQCPALPVPPAELMKRPAQLDFLSPSAGTPQVRPSSSMR